MNEIFATTKIAQLIKIANQTRLMKNKQLEPAGFLKHMIYGLKNNSTIILVSPEKGEMQACIVMTIIKEFSQIILWIDFAWIEPRNKDIGQKLMKAVDDTAKTLKANCIRGRMTRGMGGAKKKYGFKKTYEVVSKQIEED